MNRTLKIEVVIICVTLAAIALLIFAGMSLKPKSQAADEKYTLKAYQNSVALYQGSQVVEVYDEIVFDNLPEKDKASLTKGISFDTKEQASLAAEDYDG